MMLYVFRINYLALFCHLRDAYRLQRRRSVYLIMKIGKYKINETIYMVVRDSPLRGRGLM